MNEVAEAIDKALDGIDHVEKYELREAVEKLAHDKHLFRAEDAWALLPHFVGNKKAMGEGSNRPPGLLVFLGIVLGICAAGPAIALKLRISLTQMASEMAPIVAPVLFVALVVILIKSYWGSW